MEFVIKSDRIPVCGSYDVIVAGGGVAGVAAALSASRLGKSVLLIEKSVALGGLATIGLISLFVPMCNGRGKLIEKGMAWDFLQLSIRYGYDSLPEEWKNGEPESPTTVRCRAHYSPQIFAFALNEEISRSGVKVLYDTVVTAPIMEGGVCTGLIVENKSGRQCYRGRVIVDVTGDADILHRAGVPCVQGQNYFTSIYMKTTLESCEKAVRSGNIGDAMFWTMGGPASLYGKNHPEGMHTFTGTDVEDISEFVIQNQLLILDKIRDDPRTSRDIVTMPTMAQFRTTRHLVGDYTLTTDDVFEHFHDSVTAICDMDQRDYLYELPYRTMVRSGYENLITAGRSISAEGYAWDVARVIPPAILTGQAAGIAASMKIDRNIPIAEINTAELQQTLADQNVMVHFDDGLVPPIGKEGADAQAKGGPSDTSFQLS